MSRNCGCAHNDAASVETAPPASDDVVGRPVRVVSLSFCQMPLAEVCALAGREGARGADLLALPEMWPGDALEPLDGPSVTAMAELARAHRMYVVCPLYREEAGRRWNSAVLLDREGRVAGIYDKTYPYWSEFELQPPAEVGRSVPVFSADFGRLGLATCFDVNFPVVWQLLADQGAELVVWASAYSAGSSLQAHAINHHYYIVTSTLVHDCLVYDITGKLLLGECGEDGNVSRVTLDLDRGIYHQNFNLEKRDALLAEHGDEVVVEEDLPREQWFVLRAARPGVSARGLARDYGLEELRHYKARSRREIDERRGRALTPGEKP